MTNPRPTRFPVTQAHIDVGVRAECGECPIALALRDAGYEGARVGDGYWNAYEYIGGSIPDLDTFSRLSAKARGFVNNFDAGNPVKPGIITITESGELTYEPSDA